MTYKTLMIVALVANVLTLLGYYLLDKSENLTTFFIFGLPFVWLLLFAVSVFFVVTHWDWSVEGVLSNLALLFIATPLPALILYYIVDYYSSFFS